MEGGLCGFEAQRQGGGLIGRARPGKAGEEGTQCPAEDACMKENLLTCHFILCPWTKSAKITQASRPPAVVMPLATTGPREREAMLITISNPCSQILKFQRNFLCRISQDPPNNVGGWAE